MEKHLTPLHDTLHDAGFESRNGTLEPPPPLELLRINELDLLRLTRAIEKERAARMELVVASGALNALFQQWMQENAQAREANDKIKALQAEQKAAEKTYQDLIAKIGTDLGVDLREYSFDDETGVLHKRPAPRPGG